jgi:hypothetical protein
LDHSGATDSEAVPYSTRIKAPVRPKAVARRRFREDRNAMEETLERIDGLLST